MYCADESDEDRMRDWFQAHPEFLELVDRALDLAEAAA